MSNIRFEIHIGEEIPSVPVYSLDLDSFVSSLQVTGYIDPHTIDNSSQSEIMGLLNILNMVETIRTYNSTFRENLWDDREDGELSRKETVLDISEQRYDTTTKIFTECAVC